MVLSKNLGHRKREFQEYCLPWGERPFCRFGRFYELSINNYKRHTQSWQTFRTQSLVDCLSICWIFQLVTPPSPTPLSAAATRGNLPRISPVAASKQKKNGRKNSGKPLSWCNFPVRKLTNKCRHTHSHTHARRVWQMKMRAREFNLWKRKWCWTSGRGGRIACCWVRLWFSLLPVYLRFSQLALLALAPPAFPPIFRRLFHTREWGLRAGRKCKRANEANTQSRARGPGKTEEVGAVVSVSVSV